MSSAFTFAENAFATQPPNPDNVTISSNNANPSLAKIGDIVTVLFDVETGSRVFGAFGGGKSVITSVSGNTGNLTRILDGTEAEGILTFGFFESTVENISGNFINTTTDGSTVTADFTPPPEPLGVTISSNNIDPTLAKIGDIVTVLFDVETGSRVFGSIGGAYADGFVSGNTGTLTRTLDGTETEGTLIFEIIETDPTGNTFTTTTTTDGSIVTTDFTAPTSVEEPPKKSGGSNQWKTKPTFGLSHQTWIPLVDGGFTFNGVPYDITDNWHTDFPIQNVTLGELNTFEAKVYAEKKLMIQEFLFGIPQVGASDKAELGVEIWYARTGVIEDIILVQETDIVDVSTVNVTHSKVKCQESDTNENCDSTILTMKFLEPLQDDIMAIKAIDFKKRSHITFLNEGFDISGISLNPMITLFIAGPEKYDGVISITQTAKYSNLWISDDGREFEQNNYNSFKLINQSFERFVDTGIANTRAHSGFAEKIIQQQEIAQQTINEKYKAIESISRDELIAQGTWR